MKQLLSSLLIYFQFFTQIPIHVTIERPIEKYRHGIWLLPIFGFLYGLMLGLVFLLSISFLSLPVAVILVLLADYLLTGGFHHDGLADTFDGLFASRKKEEMLKIMKDPRIGANGAAALILYFFAYIFLMVDVLTALEISSQMNSQLVQVLFICLLMMVSRSSLAYMHHHFTYSSYQKNGLGKMSEKVPLSLIILAQIICLFILFLVLSFQGVLAYLLQLILLESYRQLVMKKIDGLNGDTMGAAVLLSQLFFLIIYSSLLR